MSGPQPWNHGGRLVPIKGQPLFSHHRLIGLIHQTGVLHSWATDMWRDLGYIHGERLRISSRSLPLTLTQQV